MFKRVKMIGLTLVGLLAMLGTKAEAHYVYASGQWVYHSVGCKITELDSVGTDPWAAACVVVPTEVDTRCQALIGGAVFWVNSLISNVSLVASLIDLQGAPTEQNPVEVIVSDSNLLNPVVNTSCGLSATPIAVLIRNFASTITISQCIGLNGLCLTLLSTSTAAAECELPAEYNFDDYPDNLPPDGTPFTCTIPIIEHVL